MAKILSTAQKTFIDLYDSYILSLTPDVATLPCTNAGVTSAETVFTFTYSVSVGNRKIGATCKISDNPGNIPVTITQASDSTDGTITATIAKGVTLGGKDSTIMKVAITTTDDSKVVLEKYITFIKVKTGADGTDGKDGEQIVTFKIYSENGDTFREGIEEITMETVAFDGLTQIANATYTWSYYEPDYGKWIDVSDGTTSSLVVHKSALNSSLVFKCVMTYNSSTYEDYFTLKVFNHSYDAVVKFFDGSNIFDASEPFIVAYIELYEDQKKIDGLDESVVKYYYHKDNTFDVSTLKSTFNATGLGSDDKRAGNKIYGIYKVVNPPNLQYAKYIVRLLTCREDGVWGGLKTNKDYVYKNDLYSNTHMFDTSNTTSVAPNIVVISKEDVAKYRDVNFTVYPNVLQDNGEEYVYDDNLIVARANVTVIDLNDPVISATSPAHPKEGQIWLNTSKSPYVLYVYENGKWVYFTQQNGKTVYTSKPSSYSKGDLWILAQGEVFGEFGEGTMLRAKQNSTTFDVSHWEDAMNDLTSLKNNIKQYFSFDTSTGLKIGQTDDAFYVNISSQKMSFYDNSEKQNKEVVYISNESANIDGLVVETSLDVNCNATFDGQVQFGNFVWKIENNGSLSLAISN